jgi:proteasome beta subunit
MKDPFTGPPLYSSSFVDVLRAYAPELLEPASLTGGHVPEIPHGTTVAAVRYADGVVVGGDRRVTAGMSIEQRDAEKVFPADSHSAVGVAGAFGPAVEMARLFQTELEHYEKIEGTPLSLEGKANKLAQMVRGNITQAMQGLLVVPLFCGYDQRRGTGRIFHYDPVGGRSEDVDYNTTGSGGKDARGSLKKRFRPDMDRAEAVKAIVEALFDAGEEDAATSGPDLVRKIYPQVATITVKGYERVADDELRELAEEIVAERTRTREGSA